MASNTETLRATFYDYNVVKWEITKKIKKTKQIFPLGNIQKNVLDQPLGERRSCKQKFKYFKIKYNENYISESMKNT